MGLSDHSPCPGRPLKKKGTPCFAKFTTMSSIPPRIVRPFEGFFKKLREGTLELTQWEPKVQRNPLPNHKGKRVVVVAIHRNLADVEAEKSEGSFHPNIVRTLQKNPKFRSLFNQLRFGPEARRIATESIISIIANSWGGVFHCRISCQLGFLGNN